MGLDSLATERNTSERLWTDKILILAHQVAANVIGKGVDRIYDLLKSPGWLTETGKRRRQIGLMWRVWAIDWPRVIVNRGTTL